MTFDAEPRPPQHVLLRGKVQCLLASGNWRTVAWLPAKQAFPQEIINNTTGKGPPQWVVVEAYR